MSTKKYGSVAGGKFFFIFAGFWMLFSIPFIWAGIHMLNVEQEFTAHGITVTGNVSGKHVEERDEYDRKTKTHHTSKTYYINYEFQTREGQKLESKDSVSSDRYIELDSGKPIEIQYLGDNPNQNRIAHDPDSFGGYMFCGFGSLAFLIGALTIFFTIKHRRFVNRLLQDGMLVEGTVVAVGPGSVTINNVQQWQLEYAYRDHQGQEHKGKTPHMRPKLAQEWQTGDKGRVRFDQQNPKRSIWVGREG